MSTDKQPDTSPEDQIARCREYAERKGWTVVESAVVAEAGMSGASRHKGRLCGAAARLSNRLAERSTTSRSASLNVAG